MSSKNSYSSINNFISYMINPKSFSISPKTGNYKPPKVELDSLLTSWGLLSGSYQNDGTIQTTKFSHFFQLFTIIFLWYLLFRYSISIFFDETSVWVHYFSDISMIFIEMMPRIFFQVLTVLVNMKPAIITTYFFLAQKSDRLSWLRPMLLCKEMLSPEELNLSIPMADKFWHRVYIMNILSRFMVWYTVVVCVPLYLWMTWYFWPQEYYIPYGLYTGITYSFNLYYISAHLFGFVFIFSQTCYYLSLRFDECNKHLESYANFNPNKLNLMKIMCSHNQICGETALFNKFWRFYLLIDAMTSASIMAFMLFIAFFTDVMLWIRAIFGLFSIIIIITFYGTYITASMVSSKAHKSYALLNSISIKSIDMPLNFKLQLCDYISRLGGRDIGFYCWNLSLITKRKIYDATFVLSSHFLLFLEASLKRLNTSNKYHNTL